MALQWLQFGDRLFAIRMQNQNLRRPPIRKTHYGPVTSALCVVFGVIFLFEAYVDGGRLMGLDANVLAALGGNTKTATLDKGEYWRLVTAALMHGNILHIGFNTYAMLIIGSAIEKTLGAGWVLGAFTLSSITGSLVSAYFHPPHIVAIGASGGILGLVAMAAVISYLAPRLAGFSRSALMQWLVFALVIGLAPGLDNWGHFGGIAGGVFAFLPALAVRNKPDLVKKMGYVGGAVGLVVMVLSVGLDAQNLLTTRW